MSGAGTNAKAEAGPVADSGEAMGVSRSEFEVGRAVMLLRGTVWSG